MKTAGLLIFVLLFAPGIALSETVSVGRFSADGLSGWVEKKFKGSTEYTIVQDDGRTVIRAYSKAAASGRFKKLRLDPRTHRYLQWSWKIDSTLKQGNESLKEGDDYAARVYVVFPGLFFWQSKAINYIWANRLPKDLHTPNAFTSKVMMLAVESGQEHAGKWISEERDVLADYRSLFGEEPPRIGAIAIMTDSDNTGGEATAWYGDISFSTAPRNTR